MIYTRVHCPLLSHLDWAGGINLCNRSGADMCPLHLHILAHAYVPACKILTYTSKSRRGSVLLQLGWLRVVTMILTR